MNRKYVANDGEIRFSGDCEICHNKTVPVRNHHLIPQRLLNNIPQRFAKQWRRNTVKVCDRCNKYIHIENSLLRDLHMLRAQIKTMAEENAAINDIVSSDGIDWASWDWKDIYNKSTNEKTKEWIKKRWQL